MTSKQKEPVSGTVSGWHIRILLRILTVQKLCDFNFLLGLALDLLDGFSIRRYEVKSMNLSTFLLQSLKAERCDFLGENCSGAGAFSKQGFLPCPSIIRNSKR